MSNPISRPIKWIDAPFNKAMKAGIRPLSDRFDIAVFDRIPMDIVDMPFKIALIADLMFPKAALP